MKAVVVGCGISGLFAAYKLAASNVEVVLVSPEIPDRSQSVMAAGGINAAIDTMGENDSVALHIEDTLKSGAYIEPSEFVEKLCGSAPEIVNELAEMGVMFNRDDDNNILCRSFGGQRRKRTVFAGASTGKQIMTALTGKIRRYQSEGMINHVLRYRFIEAMIKGGKCYGAFFLDENDNSIKTIYADAVVIATGGQNKLFGKTTGTVLCDGYAASRLFTQGVILKNLEFIQYHPTTIETPAKRMLITEAARGEGGRLFYMDDDGKRCYFMEEKYGPSGNLMTRDVVSKEMYSIGKDIFLDVSFLGEKKIRERISEIYDLCMDYLEIDITKEPIPVAPSVHYFMGGIRVDINHETNIRGLFAAGECVSAYHGANRLGGNSLLGAACGGRTAALSIASMDPCKMPEGIKEEFETRRVLLEREINNRIHSESKFSAAFIMAEIAKIMNTELGIVRTEENLTEALNSLDFYDDAVEKIKFDGTLTLYEGYTLPYLIKLAKGVVVSALYRKESRGAHIRSDYPKMCDEFQHATIVKYEDGRITAEGEA